MTNGVPDTGLIEAFKPLKTGGGGDRPKPSCSNCPCGLAEGTGLLCTRYPPELTMTMRPDIRGQMYPVPQVGFKPVHKSMVCWEHPEMQARLRRAVAAIEDRASVERVVYPVGFRCTPSATTSASQGTSRREHDAADGSR